MMTRRTFNSFALLFMALGSAVFTAGCNLWNDILTWIPIGEAAINSILAVLVGNGVIITPAIQTLVNMIEVGFNALTAAVKEYQSTTPAPVGALAKVQAAFKDIVDNFGTFLQSLSVPNSILGIITGLAGIVLSTIGAFVNRLPAPAGAKGATMASSMKINGNSLAVLPKERTAHAFKHDWNAILKSAPADVKIPPNAFL